VSASFDLDPVESIVADAVGEPGQRTFYVQARAQTHDIVTLIAEKEQVRLLAQALLQLLETLPEVEEGPEPDHLELEEPIDPAWRIGEMSIEYDDLTDRIGIMITEVEEGEEEVAPSPGRARIIVSRAQARALAQHALEVVASGRPRCQFCGYPLEPENHVCPAMNGHRSYHDQ